MTTTLDLMTLIAAFLWGLISAALGAWAMARAQRRRQPPPVPPAPKPITTTEALKLAANFLATQRSTPLPELSPEGPEPYPQFFARTSEEAGVLPPSRAADSPTPPTEGQDTRDTSGAALRATGLSAEELVALHAAYSDKPPGTRLAEAVASYPPDATFTLEINPLPHTYEPDPTINVPACTHCGKWPSHHNHTTGDTQ